MLQEATGQTRSVLSGARSRHLSYKRSSTPEASFDLELEHEDATVLQDVILAGGGGMPRLRAFRVEEQPDGSELAVCRFGGVLSVCEEKAAAGLVSVTFRGVFDVLESRFIETLFARDLVPAGDIAVELIEEVNAGGPTGLVVGDVEGTDPRDVTYEERKPYADGILDLADAFDFEVVPLAEADGQGFDLGRFNAWVKQGMDRPAAIFGYGADTVGNCLDASRKTLPPRNRVWVSGAEELVGLAEDFESQARYGVWEYASAMSDVLDQGLLDDRAQALLLPGPMRVVSFTPNPSKVDDEGNPVTPLPWIDYWLGDTVRLTVRKGSLQFDGSPRVDGIDIDIDDEGFESGHSVTVQEEEG